MFWDRIAPIYDLFANFYNGKTNRELCRQVKDLIDSCDNVLEYACGTGMLSVWIAEKCKFLTATDFSENMIECARKKCISYANVEFKKSDIMNEDFPNESFDKVVAANVVHLLDNPVKALQNLYRVCRSGGKIIIPTYVNGKNQFFFIKIIKKLGVKFNHTFTAETYKEFILQSGYKNAEFFFIKGRVPSVIAVIEKTE